VGGRGKGGREWKEESGRKGEGGGDGLGEEMDSWRWGVGCVGDNGPDSKMMTESQAEELWRVYSFPCVLS
jgi:hypothetical protein